MGKQFEKGIFSNNLKLKVISPLSSLHYHEDFKILFLHSEFYFFLNAVEWRTLPNTGEPRVVKNLFINKLVLVLF